MAVLPRQQELSEFGQALGFRPRWRSGAASPTKHGPKREPSMLEVTVRDDVRVSSAYHELMAPQRPLPACTIRPGPPKSGLPEGRRGGARREIHRAAQVETGHLGPITMTLASFSQALAAQPNCLAIGDACDRHARL